METGVEGLGELLKRAFLNFLRGMETGQEQRNREDCHTLPKLP